MNDKTTPTAELLLLSERATQGEWLSRGITNHGRVQTDDVIVCDGSAPTFMDHEDAKFIAALVNWFRSQDWTAPTRSDGEGIPKAAAAWIKSGERGMSSEAIWMHMACGASDGSFPLDAADFYRCHRLLIQVPAWQGRIGEMAVYGRHWAALSARWEEIDRLLCSEIGDGTNRVRAPKTSELIRQITDAAQTVRSESSEGGV